MIKPSQRREMAKTAVEKRRISIRKSCLYFHVSEQRFRYQAKLSEENETIADWLLRLTDNQRNRGALVFSLLEKCERISLEPQASVLDLPRTRAQYAH